MARSKVASQSNHRGGAPPSAGRVPAVKLALFGAVLLSLVAFFAVALTRELSDRGRTTTREPGARPAVATPRPALSAAEEAYAQALWPIHNEVKASALKMTMAGIQYKTDKLDPAGLRATVETTLETYRRAEGQIAELQPPPSLQAAHDDYLQAVRLYQQSGAEMLRVYDDRRDDHLVAAFPMSQEGGQRLRRVGGMLWPSEYVPN